MLKGHPEVAVKVAQQLSRNSYVACKEIRTLGLAASPSEKFAKLLLSWSTKSAQQDGSEQVKLTHDEMAEIIGTSRETVSRLFSEFGKKQLMQLRGATLIIRSRIALETIVQWSVALRISLPRLQFELSGALRKPAARERGRLISFRA